ncbi:MAG: hypothetical protein ACO1TE_25550 [Prosthecobacter sp.]
MHSNTQRHGLPAALPPLIRGFACALVWHCLALATLAGPRSSASYTISTDTLSSGGARSTSAAYTHEGGAGVVAGLATSSSSSETMKHGYIAQLYAVDRLHINSAPPDTIAELGTKQLSLIQILDDGSVLVADLALATWTTIAGPVITVDNTGLAHAGAVFQNSVTDLRAEYEGLVAQGQLTTLNLNLDNLPGYSGDGLDDAWQVQFFGLNNPLAAPDVITDGAGLTNFFKFTAGLVPNNSASRFLFDPQPVPAVPGQMRLVISPRLPDRTYTVITSPTLGAGAVWTPLTAFTIDDNGDTRTITDTSATGTRKFYRVEITKP